MTTKENIFDLYAQAYESQKQHRLSLKEYLEGCRADPAMYASTAERMISAIGEPEFVDSARDARLGRIFMNRTLKVYPAFKDFYGLEETIERIVGFFRHAAQGLEEKKQILYLLGPVGGGKSSLAERLKDLMEKCPIYVLATNDGAEPDLREPARAVRSGLHGPDIWRSATASRSACCSAACRRGRSSASTSSAATSPSSRSSSSIPPSCARSAWPRPSRATRTTRTSPRWSARSTSASSSTSARTTPTPTPTRAASTARRRAFSSSSRCSRRRSRCCTRC